MITINGENVLVYMYNDTAILVDATACSLQNSHGIEIDGRFYTPRECQQANLTIGQAITERGALGAVVLVDYNFGRANDPQRNAGLQIARELHQIRDQQSLSIITIGTSTETRVPYADKTIVLSVSNFGLLGDTIVEQAKAIVSGANFEATSEFHSPTF